MTIRKTGQEARQGEASGIGRRILVGSLALAVVALLIGAVVLGIL